MKKKQFLKTTLLALALALCGASTAWADEVEVSTQAEFKTAYDAAQSSNETGNAQRWCHCKLYRIGNG